MKRLALFTVHCLLLLAFWLLVGSALQKSATVDEQSHLFRGAAYLKANATHFLLGHPLGNSALTALPLLTEPDLALPTEIPAWEAGNWSVAGDHFLWRIGNNAQRILFLGRLPIIFCTLLLGCLLYRWGRQLRDWRTGLIAVLLILFDPNIIAHGRLVTSDVTLTLFWAVAVYGLWRWTRGGGWRAIGLAGFGLGAASLMKYNAVFLLLTLVILAGVEGRRRGWRDAGIAFAGVVAVGGLVIWAVNGFALAPLPGGAFWDDLFWQMAYFGRNTGGYLFGTYYPNGSPFYFPAAYLVKTPIPILLLAMLAVWFGKDRVSLSHLTSRNALFLTIPIVVFAIAAFSAGFNIGIRHLLPLYPFLYLLIALGLSRGRAQHAAPLRIGVVGLLLATVGVGVWAFPNYLSYFNLVVGGSDEGWRYLADSNVDWGQDLPALAEWQQEHDNLPLYLSYFGTAHAEAYGVDFRPIPAPIITPDQPPITRQAYDPRHPAPGYYAISVNNLIGFPMPTDQRDHYAYFREREPVAKIGGSIFIYEVEPTGERVDVAFAGTRPELLPESVYELWQTNDVRVRWFDDPTTRLVVPSGERAYVVMNELPSNRLLRQVPSREVLIEDRLFVYKIEADVQVNNRQPYSDGLRLERLVTDSSNNMSFITAWRVLNRIDEPLQIFAHAIDDDELISQSDVTALPPFARWYADDVYLHLHQLVTPPLQSYQAVAGFYSAETLIPLAEPLPLFAVAVSD